MQHVIVNIRGTSGSGKSTVARRVMEWLMAAGHANHQELAVLGGKERISGHQVGPVFFVGKYSTDCGGCDSMSWKGAADDICSLVHHKSQFGPVVFEGLMISSWGTGRLLNLWEVCGKRVHVLQLTTSLEECLASVQARRERAALARGKVATPLDPTNTAGKHRSAAAGAAALQNRGMETVEFVDRETAFTRALGLVAPEIVESAAKWSGLMGNRGAA